MTSAQTHPFLTFDFDTMSLSRPVWMLLGEAMSKCEHLAGSPLKPGAALEMSSVFLARGVKATTAIEGNTLSEEEVQRIVNNGSADVSESRAYLELEVRNVLSAIRDIDAALRNGVRLPITTERLCALNLQLLDGIPDRPEVVPGRIRQHDVRAGSYRPPNWDDVPTLTEHLVRWLDQLRSQVTPSSRREDRFVVALLSAILAHVYIAWVHPFGNGNGRLARLIEVQILSESGVVPIVATNLLSDHYNKTRNAYYLSLDAAQRDVCEFISYALRGFVDELRDQIEMVRVQNLQTQWESYVYEVFRGHPGTPARARQREAALHILASSPGITPEDLTLLTPRIAKRYAALGPRIPARDLNDLVKMGLVAKTGKRTYRARREIVEAFIPPTADA